MSDFDGDSFNFMDVTPRTPGLVGRTGIFPPRTTAEAMAMLGDSRSAYHGTLSGPSLDWRGLQEMALKGPMTPTVTASAETKKVLSQQEVGARLDLVCALIEAEKCRCQAIKDFDDRDEAFAGLLEGEDRVLERISSGLTKYMNLVFQY